jgi:hypothetical protein
MNNLTQNLKEWREKRNITDANTKVFVLNTIEELLEIYFDDKDVINDNKHGVWSIFFTDFYSNDLQPISESNSIDAIQDIQVFCINETELMGYDNLKCNEEVFKEINSRVQCPNQMIEWKEKGAYGKWKKYDKQDKDSLYKANYEGCKL